MKKQLGALMVLLVGCLAFAGCDDSSSTSSSIIDAKYYEETEGKTSTIENDDLKFDLNQDTTTFSVTNKKTGKVWTSNPAYDEIDKYANAKGKGKNVLYSTLLVKYSNKTDTQVDIDNYSKSIKNKNYTIEKVSDTEIKVNYTIGEVDKIYICPPAISETNMQQWLDKMDDATQRLIKRNYKYYNYEELADEDRDTALANFPDLESEPVYMLRTDISDSWANKIQEAFTAVGYTEEDYQKDKEAYSLNLTDEQPMFNISIHYILEGDQFVVKVPMNEIQYRSTYPIVELSVLPYMGAGNTDDKGFIIVPDGSGGIINFNNGKKDQQTYTSNVYGWDYGLYRDMVVDETSSSFPMFAICKNGTSMICTAEEGSSYAVVKADVSGKQNGYNFGQFTYQMIHGENMDISAKSDTTVRVFESSLPKDETITQRYMFDDTDDYISLANQYRSYLMKTYPELKKKTESTVPLSVEMIGAVDNTEHILGYPVTRSQALTTYSQAKDILSQLVDAGIDTNSINAKYSGWFNTGELQTSAAKVSLIGRLGSSSDLKDLSSYANEKGVSLYMNGSFNYVYKDKWFDGFGENSNAAKYVSREIAEIYNIYPVTFVEGKTSYWLTKPSYAKECVDNFLSEITDYGTKNVSFDDYGSKLGADYNPKDPVSREANMKSQQETLKTLKENGSKVMVNGDYLYTLPYADIVNNVNITSKKINLIDETIPFYEIVLHGVVNYTGNAINLAEDYEENLLKSAETGAGLYYVYMDQPTSVLQDGDFTKYYACNFDDWKKDTVDLYSKFKSELGDIYNQYIVGHKQLANGVYMTTYENGKNVIVNYNYNDYDYNGTTVPKRNFITEGGGE